MWKKSLKKQIMLAMAALIILFTVLFLGFCYAYFRSNRMQYQRDLQIISSQYSDTINRDIRQANTQVEQYFSESSYYHKIVAGKIPDPEWAKGVYYIKSDLTTQAATLPFRGAFFFYDRYRDCFFSSFHEYEESTLPLNNYLKDISRREYGKRLYYGYESFQEHLFLVYYLSLNGNPVGYLLDLTDCFRVGNGMEVIFLTAYPDEEEPSATVLTMIGDELFSEKEAMEIVLSGKSMFSSGTRLAAVAQIPEFPGLYLVTASSIENKSIWYQKSFWALIVFVPAAFLCICLYFFRMLKHTLLNPVTHLYNRMKQIQQQESFEDSDRSAEIAEYKEINDQLDVMLQQIADLRESRLREQIRTNEALLQYYQLQTDPHFFLSCLNTVSSMLESGREEMADNMIQALSAHFRYMFRGNRMLVTLQEELMEVQDYCEIYRIRSGIPILLDSEVSEEAGQFMIPLLSVMTFVENAVKHSGKPDQVLKIRIQASVLREEAVRYLNLRITDNGSGYSEENLKELNAAVDSYEYVPNHVGVRNLKYRLKLLYGEKAEWFFYNSPSKAAVAELNITEVPDECSDH